MFLRIEPPHRQKSAIPREVRLIFEFLTDASLPPPSRITPRVIRRGGAPGRRSLIGDPARNQALLSGAPPSLAALRSSMSPPLISPLPSIRITLPSPALKPSLTSWHPYRY